MKKLLLLAFCASWFPAYALPTYEPFTEYSNAIVNTGTNSIDLTTGNFSVTTGNFTEQWGGLLFSGTAGTGQKGLDVQVTNNSASVFTATALSSILPSGFPGLPATGAIQYCALVPTNANANILGNSAVLEFSQDILRPANGVETIYVSYLLNITAVGITGSGNNGRYCCFLASSNLVEPASGGAAYQTWNSMFNTFGTGADPTYVAYGVKTGSPAISGGDDLLPDDSSGANSPATGLANVGAVYNTANFVVGCFTFTTGGSTKDTNTLWANPPVSSFGGNVPSTQNVINFTMGTKMSDVDGFCLIDRLYGASGGTGLMYVGNLLIGTTWSFVTGGPEFTNQPVSVSGSGPSVSLSAAAMAAGQTVAYQWQHIVAGTPNTTNNVTSGAGGAGGAATVSMVTNANGTTMTLANMSAADAGSYLVVATASGTGFILASSTATVTNDPIITVEPQSTSAPLGGSAMFNISASTTNSPLSFRWKLNGSNISNGTLGDNSTVTIVSGPASSTLTIGNYQADENGAAITCGVTNSISAGELSAAATLTTSDPAITGQPLPATANYGQTATFTASVETVHPGLKYAWYKNSAMMVSGPQPGGSTASGAQGTNAGSSLTTTLTLSSVSYQDNGSYSLVATNSLGSTVTSAVVTLFVADPVISNQPPATVEVAQGSNATISIVAAGSGVTYQWYNSGGPLSGDFSGATTPNLTLTGAQPSDAGTYYVQVIGATNTLQSANVNLIVDTAMTAVAVSPPALTQQVGTHLALLETATGGSGLLHFQWQLNGTNLANGIQADGSWISGATATATNPGLGALVITNIHVADSGTYTVTAYNAAGTNNSGSAVLTVSPGLQPLSSNNLIVARVGDGAEPLSSTTGNTVYLDQLTTAGTYTNTLMVPDTVTASALIVPGGPFEGTNGTVLTRSANGSVLNFCGFQSTYPAQAVFTGENIPRVIASVNAVGFYQLVQTNPLIYDGSIDLFTSVVSPDGAAAFWTTGAAGSPPGVKYNTTASIATGGANMAIAGSATGTRVINIINTNVAYSDLGVSPAGVFVFTAPGEPTTAETPNGMIIDTAGSPNDFAASPDTTSYPPTNTSTIYVGDSTPIANGGGIQRDDWNGSSYSLSYTLGTGASSTVGASCLTVDFSANATWGTGVTGAIIYATTAGASGNSLIKIVDTGSGSTATTLETANVNQILRGVRFGPVDVPVSIVNPVQAVTTYTGQSTDLTVGASGDAPLSYQWQFDGTNIAGATTSSLLLTGLQGSNSGTYSVIVSDPISTNSSSAVVSVTAGPPQLLVPSQNRVETVGDHLAFSATVTGTAPITYQWKSNGVVVAGATASAFGLTNIVLANSGTYSVTYANQFGTNTASATLLVTTNLQSLSSNNLVVSRVGDGLQPLNSLTGNTVYLDQITPLGVYSNTIMIPDETASTALIVPGGTPEGPIGSVLTELANTTFLNYCGFNATYPTAGGFTGEGITRVMGAVNAFGFYQLVAKGVAGLYDGTAAGDDLFNCVVSLDGYGEFWTSGSASAPPGLKYVTPTSTANAAIGGSASGTRVVQIIAGNLVYSDVETIPAGIWVFSGEPTSGATVAQLISDLAGSPNDFAASPDTTSIPPSTSTVYVGDSSSIGAGGGIQRYDWNSTSNAYVLAYTLGTGSGSTVGASCLAVDFSANNTWGPGVTGAKIYATTTGNPGNSLIKIVDTGSNSTATVLDAATGNEILRGVRFGPVEGPPIIVSNPQPQTAPVGGTAVFTVVAENGPLSYQWQLNGTNLANGPSISGSGATITGAFSSTLTITNVGAADDKGSYTVVVSNAYGGVTSTPPAVLTVSLVITVYPPLLEYVANGGTAVFSMTATGGGPITYTWYGPCGGLSDGSGGDPCNTGAVVAGSSTNLLTISGVGPNDAGDYYVQVTSPSGEEADNFSEPAVLVVVTPPQFAPGGPITGLGGGSPQLNFSGQAGTPYHIWGSTNLALTPITRTWTLLGSGTFSGGADSFTIRTTNGRQFYALTQP